MENQKGEREFLSVKEVCEMTGIKQARLMRKIRKEEVKAQKIGWVWAIRRSEVELLIKSMADEE